ncbi:MAG: DUF1934 domain-containing protein [Clostridia bacterium]|nr:DUF1934 domain-containing protein [Clostridia bacterium]
MKDIVIKINSDIRVVGEEPHLMEMTMPAKFYKKGAYLYIAYEETELTGMAGDKTVLKLSEDAVTMLRYGSNPSEMFFKENESYETDYTTPYGVIKMENTASDVAIHVTDTGKGYLEVVYDLEISGISKSVNILRIEIIA